MKSKKLKVKLILIKSFDYLTGYVFYVVLLTDFFYKFPLSPFLMQRVKFD